MLWYERTLSFLAALLLNRMAVLTVLASLSTEALVTDTALSVPSSHAHTDDPKERCSLLPFRDLFRRLSPTETIARESA